MSIPSDTAELFDRLDEETVETLRRYPFDGAEFLGRWRRLRQEGAAALSPEVDRPPAPPGPDALDVLPSHESVEGRRLISLGEEALEAGEVGIVILNGGMATRFGEVVKGCQPVVGDDSFLGLTLKDAARWDGAVDILLMNSFATAEATEEHLQAHDYFGVDPETVFPFSQGVSLRLTPDGRLFRDEEGRASLHSTGHGDLADALRRGPLDRFLERGGRYLLVSNIDNALATLDPLIVGYHVRAAKRSGMEMTGEAVESLPDDAGGKPVEVDGELRLLESFRAPNSALWDTIPVHNTNNLWFTAEALDRSFNLDFYPVKKRVGGQPAIQFERIVGELSHALDFQVASVPRDGEYARYCPVKRPEDLEEHRGRIRSVLRRRGVTQ
jgi:UTP--glucose-1-phosphate uridylyltransferase